MPTDHIGFENQVGVQDCVQKTSQLTTTTLNQATQAQRVTAQNTKRLA